MHGVSVKPRHVPFRAPEKLVEVPCELAKVVITCIESTLYGTHTPSLYPVQRAFGRVGAILRFQRQTGQVKKSIKYLALQSAAIRIINGKK